MLKIFYQTKKQSPGWFSSVECSKVVGWHIPEARHPVINPIVSIVFLPSNHVLRLWSRTWCLSSVHGYIIWRLILRHHLQLSVLLHSQLHLSDYTHPNILIGQQ